MKPFISRLALLWATLMVVVSGSLVGCGEPTGTEFVPPALQVDLAVPSGLCDGDTVSAFCAASTVKGEVDLGDTEKPYTKTNDLKLADDGLCLSATFTDLPNNAGHTFDVALTLDVDLPVGYEIRQSSGGAFTGEVTIFGDADEDTQIVALEIVAGAEVPQGSGKGNACIKVIDTMNMAVDTKDCTFSWNTQSINTSTPPDGVTCDDAYLADLSIGTAELKVVCGELKGSLPTAKVAEDEMTNITVVVSTESAQPSGKGDLCVNLTDSNGGNVDESKCTFTVDGLPVTPDADAGMLCDGTLFVGLTAKVSVVQAVCEGGLSGSLSTQIVSDDLIDVGVTVSEAPPDFTIGDACWTVSDKNGVALNGCTFDWLQIASANEPSVSGSPPPSCAGPGNYFFSDMDVGTYDVVVTCGANKGQGNIQIVGNAEAHAFATAQSPVADGVLCSLSNGIALDLDTSTVDVALHLGYGAGGLCVPITVAQAATISLTAWSGPSCVDKNDVNCTINVQGLKVSVPNWMAYGPSEERIFEVTATDTSMKTVKVYVHTLNGYFVDL